MPQNKDHFSTSVSQSGRDAYSTFFRISPEERKREGDRRDYFARFWAEAGPDVRAAYDRFISACPLSDGVTLEQVDEGEVGGWWLRPDHPPAGQAILFIHGGAYVLGSALAYRGLASQVVDRTRIPALVIDYRAADLIKQTFGT
ncbi:alpha/beta hydrolase [Ancylobacter oerskovii]|uniref:Alpha/beta hydrolase n=1 Tax=Ancylobacter oerskovii TaxID=459519 RepID=A0ABW4Z5P9_9HYPH|nr:alpha/beta hydrolase fold domain-containing protein [Ancylobacter oerskovii]MBS7542479.1 alpha/beta hydrolase fold domain-containing protein [Ancylobacter oerskovii]